MGIDALEACLERLGGGFTGRVARDVPLAPLTTYRLGGPAAALVEPESPGDVELLAVAVAHARTESELPVLSIGRGSNLVVSDLGWPGIVVRLGPSFAAIGPGDAPHTLRAGAAAPLPQVANRAAALGLAGFEFGVSIPGAVGGGVRMNAGAHGNEIADVLVAADVASLATGERGRRPAAALDLSYRHSNLTDDDIVVQADFALAPDDAGPIRRRMAENRAQRAATQPGAAQNAGSVFTNPPGDSAGRLVEQAGLKGFRVGGVEVSHLHANFFVAGPGATAADVHALVGEVARRVADATGISLTPEIRFVGEFG